MEEVILGVIHFFNQQEEMKKEPRWRKRWSENQCVDHFSLESLSFTCIIWSMQVGKFNTQMLIINVATVDFDTALPLLFQFWPVHVHVCFLLVS